jgi:flagellar biosynthesis protein FlhF
MYLKRFRGATVRDALRAAREALGPDALVLSTAMVPSPGWRGMMGLREVEITAAAERGVSARRPEESAVRHQPADRESDSVRARLVAAGLDDRLAEEVSASLDAPGRRGASVLSLSAALATRLSSLAAADSTYAPVEVFVGPPGAGKTTTIAKIAAQERTRRGRTLGIVAADGFRVGAVDQLRTYADILDAPFQVARAPRDLERALARRHPQPMLVDTAGRSPSDDGVRELFQVIAGRPDIRTHLVLPAGTSASAARRIFDLYADAQPTRLVLTKVDEADSLAPLVGVLRERQIPISYLGTGQRMPNDLDRATAQLLASAVLGEPVRSTGARS